MLLSKAGYHAPAEQNERLTKGLKVSNDILEMLSDLCQLIIKKYPNYYLIDSYKKIVKKIVIELDKYLKSNNSDIKKQTQDELEKTII